jgi:hypothetical protein
LKTLNVKFRDADYSSSDIINETEDIFDLAYGELTDQKYNFLLKLYSQLIFKFNSSKTKKSMVILTTLLNKIRESARNNEFDDIFTENFTSIYFGATNFDISELFQNISKTLEDDVASKNNKILDKKAICIYLLVLTSNDNFKNEYYLIKLQRYIAELIARNDSKKLKKTAVNNFCNSLSSNASKTSFIKSTYLYHGVSDDINKNMERIKELSNYISNINDKSQLLLREKSDLVRKIDILDKTIYDKNMIIEDLNLQTKKAEDNLIFEKNKYEMQYNNLKSGFARRFKKSFDLELQGIEDVIQYLPEKERAMIVRRLNNMRKIIEGVEGL